MTPPRTLVTHHISSQLVHASQIFVIIAHVQVQNSHRLLFSLFLAKDLIFSELELLGVVHLSNLRSASWGAASVRDQVRSGCWECAEIGLMEEHLKDLLGRFKEQFGSGPGLGPGSGTCLMKIDGVGPPFIKSLYKAAASLYRSDPWRRLRPGHLFGVRVGKDREWYGRKQPFPCVQFIGGDGGDLAIHMFRSAEDARKTSGARETRRVGNVEVMRVTYEVESLMFVSNKRMVKCLGVEKSGEERFPVFDVVRCTSSGGLEFRNPTLEELRFAYAVVMAVALVHPLLREDGEPPKYSRTPSFEPFIETVDVQWPAQITQGQGVNDNDLVAVTVSHPPNQGYQDSKKEI